MFALLREFSDDFVRVLNICILIYGTQLYHIYIFSNHVVIGDTRMAFQVHSEPVVDVGTNFRTFTDYKVDKLPLLMIIDCSTDRKDVFHIFGTRLWNAETRSFSPKGDHPL